MSKKQVIWKVGLGLKRGLLLLALVLGTNAGIQPSFGMIVPDSSASVRIVVSDAPDVVPDSPDVVPDAPNVVPDGPE